MAISERYDEVVKSVTFDQMISLVEKLGSAMATYAKQNNDFDDVADDMAAMAVIRAIIGRNKDVIEAQELEVTIKRDADEVPHTYAKFTKKENA